MSKQFTPVLISDPRITQFPAVSPVVSGGQKIIYKVNTSSNVSNNSITIQANPPSANMYVDRRMHLRLPARVKFTALIPGAPAGLTLLEPGRVCIRSYPAHKALQSISAVINGLNVSTTSAEYIAALEHFNIDERLRRVEYSKCPTYGTSQSQQFDDLFQSNRSPMALYASGIEGSVAQSSAFTIVEQTNDGAGNLTATLDFVTTEPLFLSPLFSGSEMDNEFAFAGVQTMEFAMQFLGNAGNRMVAIDKEAYGLPVTSWNSQVSFSNFSGLPFSYNVQPAILTQYITPKMDMPINTSEMRSYPYHTIESTSAALNSVAAGSQGSASTNAISVNSTPSKIYVYIRKNNATMEADPFNTDCFFKINKMTVQWGEQGSNLSSADTNQLYDISVANGCAIPFPEWAGQGINKQSIANNSSPNTGFGAKVNQYFGCGSVIAFNPAVNLGLEEDDAPGRNKKLTIQVNVDYENISGETVDATLYMVVVYMGQFTLIDGTASSSISTITPEDIRLARDQAIKNPQQVMLSFADVNRMYGGSFLSNISSKIGKLVKKYGPAVKKVFDVVRTVAPEVKALLAAGNGGVRAMGVRARGVRAGKAVSRATLKSRMKRA